MQSLPLILLAALLTSMAWGATRARAEDDDVRGLPQAAPALRAPMAPALDMALTPASPARDIPWDRLDRAAYERVRDVVQGAVVSREVRDIAFRSRKPVFEFLLDHPDFAAGVARALREGKYRVRSVGDGWEADDGHGAHGRLRVFYAESGRRLFYLEGHYDTPLLPTLSGRLVMMLDADHVEGSDGITYCEMRVAGHLRLDSTAAEVVATVARSFGEAQVDKKVRRFFGHVAKVSRRAYDDPEGLADELARRPELPAEQVTRFREVLMAHLPPGWSETLDFRLLDTPLQ